MKIDAVIVTYNRLEKLKKAIEAFEKQTYLPQRLIIVNNNSNDKTKEFLENWEQKKDNFEKVIINMDENIGGAGGFAVGMKYALENNSEWLWVSDDDAYPDKNALKIANDFLEKHKNENISAICGTVLNKEGKIDFDHRRYLKEGIIRLKEINTTEEDYKKECFNIDLFTYVATIINVKKMNDVGISNKDFFIYYDDSDHAARLRKVGKIICVPKITTVHDVDKTSKTADYSWKTYYLFRNKLFFLKNNFKHKYVRLEIILIWLRIFKKKNKSCTRLILTAINDFKNNKLGKNSEYIPGKNIYKS